MMNKAALFFCLSSALLSFAQLTQAMPRSFADDEGIIQGRLNNYSWVGVIPTTDTEQPCHIDMVMKLTPGEMNSQYWVGIPEGENACNVRFVFKQRSSKECVYQFTFDGVPSVKMIAGTAHACDHSGTTINFNG